MLNKNQQEFIEAIQGSEILFEDIGCVGIEGNNLIKGGIVILKIDSAKTYKRFIDAYNMDEYGTTDFKVIMKMEGF